MRWILHVFVPALLSVAILLNFQKQAINYFLMCFFRDVGRIKARNRRLQNVHALVGASNVSSWDILLRREDPLAGVDFDAAGHHGDRSTFTMQELAEYGDGLNGRPILLSIFGMVYDVSAGQKFYGPEGNYHMFAGKDVTRALSKGCKTPDCLVRDTGGLAEKHIAEGKRWLSFFQLHDKYSFVGRLEGDRESWLDKLVDSTVDGRS